MATVYQSGASDGIAFSATIDDKVFNTEQKLILGKDLPEATALAMNWLSFDIKSAVFEEMKVRYDRPKKWTLNSLFVERPNKADWPAINAAVYFKEFASKGNPAGRYLHPTIAGVSRPHKGFEKALIRANLMNGNEYAVPGKGVKLNQYGNISGGIIKQMLSQLKAGNAEQYETETSREKKRGKTGRIGGNRYFVPSAKSSLPRGVYRRSGRGDPKLLFLFVVDSPDYKILLPFQQIGERIVRWQHEGVFERAFDKIVKSRRDQRLRSIGSGAAKSIVGR